MIRYGIIGCGSAFTQNHLGPMKQVDGLRITALADTDAARLAELSGSLGIRQTYADYRRMLAEAEIDAVLIALPPTLNRDAAVASARAHKHVLLEKPIATTLEAARDIIDACTAGRVKLCIGHQRRYASTERKAKELLDDGCLGRVFRVKVRHAVDCAKWLNEGAGWRTDVAVAGGGIWLLWGVHYADLLRFLTGAEAESVYAQVRNVACPDIDTEDNAFGLVRMSGGILGEVEVSATWKPVEPASFGPAGEIVEIYGTEGSLVYSRTDGLMRLTSSRPDPPGSQTLNVPGGPADWVSAERMLHEAFLTSILGGTPSPVSGEDGTNALEIILAGYVSSREDRVVRHPLDRGAS